jgi:hypothetical protein
VESTAGGNVAVDFFEELDDERYLPFSTGEVNAEEIEGRVVETRALGDVPTYTGTGDGILVEVDLKMGRVESASDFVVGLDLDCVGLDGRHGHGEVFGGGEMVEG